MKWSSRPRLSSQLKKIQENSTPGAVKVDGIFNGTINTEEGSHSMLNRRSIHMHYVNGIQPSSVFRILLGIIRRNIFGKFIKFSLWRCSSYIWNSFYIQIRKWESFENQASRIPVTTVVSVFGYFSHVFVINMLNMHVPKTSWCRICFEKLKLAQNFNRTGLKWKFHH